MSQLADPVSQPILGPDPPTSTPTANHVSTHANEDAVPRVLPPRPTVRTRGISVSNTSDSHIFSAKPSSTSSFPSTSPQGLLSFTVAVLGSSSVGKTTVVSKGFKKLRVTKESSAHLAKTDLGKDVPYTLRKAQVGFSGGENASEPALADITILEANICDIAPLFKATWPPSIPNIDAAFLCYDVSDEASFDPVPSMISNLYDRKILTLVLACKSDLQKTVQPTVASEHARTYHAGLVEVDAITKRGKEKMRHLVDWTVKTLRKRHSSSSQSPISPGSLSYTGLTSPISEPPQSSDAAWNFESQAFPPGSIWTSDPLSSDRRSTTISVPMLSFNALDQSSGENSRPSDSSTSSRHNTAPVDGHERATPSSSSTRGVFQTLDELLDRLFSVTISGDDKAFADNFFLTYRRFATPRSVLLGFQRSFKRLADLEDPSKGYYASLRLGDLLEYWIHSYPHDFTSKGALRVLSAIQNRIQTSEQLVHYAVDLNITITQHIGGGVDKDKAWAIPSSLESEDENSDSYSMVEESVEQKSGFSQDTSSARLRSVSAPEKWRIKTADGASIKSSPPIYERAITYSEGDSKPSIKQMKDVANKLNTFTSLDIAEEITRIQWELFVAIEPRDWMHHVMVKSSPDDPVHAVRRFSLFYNHLGAWVASIVLCHDSAKGRVKQITKFVEVAKELRKLQNFAGVRSVTVGIMNATFEGDRVMEMFQETNQTLHKQLLGYGKLFSSAKSYGTYRMALKSMSRASIPDTEVHTYDIVRLLDISSDFHPEDRSKIHWGKFNAAGKLIWDIMISKDRCLKSSKYTHLPDREDVRDCIVGTPPMTTEMQYARIPAPDVQEGLAQSPPGGFRKLANILR